MASPTRIFFLRSRPRQTMATILAFTPMDQFPNRLRALRKQHKMTLEQVDLEIGTSIAQVAQLEKGQRPLTPKWAQRFATLFRLKPGELLNPEDNPNLLTPEEEAFLDRFRAASDDQRKTLGGVMDVIIPYRAEPALDDQQDWTKSAA